MRFRFDFQKTVQAIGVLFREEGSHELDYLRILKLLYLADCESMASTGRPITGDRVVAMDHGQVLSETYDLIKGQHTRMPEWDRFFVRSRYSLRLQSDPDVSALSRHEIETLQTIARRHENDSQWDLVNLLHNTPEWKSHYLENTSRLISAEDILQAVGRADTAAIAAEVAVEEVFDDFFAETS